MFRDNLNVQLNNVFVWENFKYALPFDHYSVKAALLWGNCAAHFQKGYQDCRDYRPRCVVHFLIGVVLLIPVIGQIASLFERIIIRNSIKKMSFEAKLDVLKHNWLLRGNSEQGIEFLLQYSVNPDIKIEKNRTLLMKAIAEGDIGIAQMCIEAGVDLDSKDEDGNTALMLAILKGQRLIALRLLQDYGADAEIENNEGISPSMLLQYQGNHKLLKAWKENSKKKVDSISSELETENLKDFDRITIVGDGHCLFNSIGYFIQDFQGHQDLRNQVANALGENEEYRLCFGYDETKKPNLDENWTFEDYIEDIRNMPEWEGEGDRPLYDQNDDQSRRGWGSQLEIRVMHDILKRPICLYDKNREKFSVYPYTLTLEEAKENQDTLFVYYDGQGHFEALQLKNLINDLEEDEILIDLNEEVNSDGVLLNKEPNLKLDNEPYNNLEDLNLQVKVVNDEDI